jgi:HAD superfamily hydrolase (TIGR01509 family)
MTERPHAVAFDFNGTISDDEVLLAVLYEELFAELGRPITPQQYLDELAGHTDEEMLTRWLGSAEPEVIAERVARYNARVADGSTVDEEARAAVRFAAEHVPVALVSSAFREEIDPVLEVTGLRPAFSAIVSGGDVVNGKPDPEAYLNAAELLGISPTRMLVFEDTAVGVAAGKAGGAHVVGLTRTLGAERMSAADELVERLEVATLERLLCS